MRKFTKEIAALLASAAVGTTLCAGAASAATEPELEETAGALSTEEEYVTEFVGTMMMEEETTTAHSFPVEIVGETVTDTEMTDATETEYEPEVEGLIMASDPEELEPLVGDIALPDDEIDTTEELPPLVGDPLPADEDITDPEEFPPVAGIPLPEDGDIDGSGDLGVTDVVALQRWLHGDPEVHPVNLWAADLYPDGVIDVFDLGLMQKKLLETFNDAH